MPGAFAPDTRPVDTDLLHCFSSPRSAAHPGGAVAGSSPALLARLFGEHYEFWLPWGVTRRCLPGGMSRRDRSLTRRWYRAGRVALSGDQAQLPGARDGLGAVGGAELAQDMGHVLFDRVERHHQVARDALV